MSDGNVNDRDQTEFSGSTVAQALVAIARRLADAGIDNPRHEARLLLRAAAGITPEAQIKDPARVLGEAERGRLGRLATRRARREPMAYVLGEREFFGLPFMVDPSVLVPRPETETVVEAACEAAPAPARVLDFGSGSGCLLLALLQIWPDSFGIGVDRSRAALVTARRNAARLDLEARAAFVAADWGEGLAGVFDLIVSNPPYITENALKALVPEVRDHEPRTALAGGSDGLDAYRALAPHAARLLAPGGALVLEIGAGQGPAVAAILATHGLAVVAARDDLAGIARALVARRAVAVTPNS